MNRSDLSEYEEIKDGICLNTASKSTKPLQVRGKGAMFLTISEDDIDLCQHTAFWLSRWYVH